MRKCLLVTGVSILEQNVSLESVSNQHGQHAEHFDGRFGSIAFLTGKNSKYSFHPFSLFALTVNAIIRNRTQCCRKTTPSSRPSAVLRQHTTVVSDRRACHQHPATGSSPLHPGTVGTGCVWDCPIAPQMAIVMGKICENDDKPDQPWDLGDTHFQTKSYTLRLTGVSRQ